MQILRITRPDDWHVHLRDGLFLKDTVPATAEHFSRALVMPNLKPALTSLTAVLDYRERILAALTANNSFFPCMTFYLNEQVSADELKQSRQYPFILGAKLYPAGATTNSDEGVRSLKALYPLLEVMQENDQVLQIHGEVTEGDIFERESAFIAQYLQQLTQDFPDLRIVLEHISTRAAVDFVLRSSDKIAATITPHHLFYNRNKLLAGGIRPHYYCLPVLKHADDQRALQQAAVSGNPRFFVGTDSAPHLQSEKESGCGCAGIYSAPYAVAMYAQIFDEWNALDRLESFLSHFGADFYRLPHNQTQISLVKKTQVIPSVLNFGEGCVVPAGAGESLLWSVYE